MRFHGIEMMGDLETNNIKAKDSDGITFYDDGDVISAKLLDGGTFQIPTVDINSGAIDGATIATSNITVGSGKTLNVASGILTLANDQISGDKVEGGTIASITISSIDLNGGTIDGSVVGASSPAAGTFTILKANTDPTDANGVGDRGFNDARYCLEANNLSDLDSISISRNNLGLGTLALLNNINNDNWSGTDLAINNGGTGASTAPQALINLGLTGTVTSHNHEGTYLKVANDLSDLSSASSARTNLGLTGTSNTTHYHASYHNIRANNLSDVGSALTARANLGVTIGSHVQAWNAGLQDVAGLAKTDGNFIVGDGSNWIAESGVTARTSLGLGSLATLSSINNSNWSGTDLALVNGGTGASDAAAARTNLGFNQSAVRVRHADALVALPYGVKTKINLTVESYDLGNEFNTSTSRFTAAATGYYLVCYNSYLQHQDNLELNSVTYILKNGSVANGFVSTGQHVGATHTTLYSLSTTINLTAGDYLEVYMVNDYPGSTNVYTDGVYGTGGAVNDVNVLTIHRLF